MKHGRISIAPDAAIVRRFTVALRGANRANDMTAMIAAPVSQTMFAAPARVKLSSRPAGSIASKNDTGEQAIAKRASQSCDCYMRLRNRDGRGNANGDCFHEYIVHSLHYTKQMIAKYK